MFKLYTIFFSRDSKTKKVRHPHPHQHQYKKNWKYNYEIAFVFLIFLSFSISFPVLFRISVFWFSCLGSPEASRHALGPAALGYGEVTSFNLNNIKTNPRKKNPFHFTLFKHYSGQKKIQQNIEIAFKFKLKISNKLIGPRKKKY